jgi:hypothetical protein
VIRVSWVCVLVAAGKVVGVEGPFASRQAAQAWCDGDGKQGAIAGEVHPAVRGEKNRRAVLADVAKGKL